MTTAGDGSAPYESSGTKESSVRGFSGQVPKHAETIENLPDELLLNIFIRLLAKQITQMRSVSKSWKALLSESSFVKSHLHRSVHNNDRILLVFYSEGFNSSNIKPYATLTCRSPHHELTNFIKIPPVINPESGRYTRFRVFGSVNGLICSSYDDVIIQIWNPSLSAVSTLPPYSLPPSHPFLMNLRFGYDPKTDDYKVFKLAGRIVNKYSRFFREWLQVEVYSMRKGTWKLITERFPSDITRISDHDYVCVDGHDGHLHWLCKKTEIDTILAFDLGSETFREIPLPDSILCMDKLVILDKKLCVMSPSSFEILSLWFNLIF